MNLRDQAIALLLGVLLSSMLSACKTYPKKEPVLLDARYHFYSLEESNIKELDKYSLPSKAEPFPKFSVLQWKKYFSVLAYQKASGDLRLISTVFTREQVREFLPLFLDAHALVKNKERLLFVANDYPYRSVNSLPSLTNFMIWFEDKKVNIVFGSINKVLFEFGRMSDPKFKIDFKDLKIFADSDGTRLVIAKALLPAFQKKKIAGVHRQKWLTTDADWFLKKTDHSSKEKPNGDSNAPTQSDDKTKDPSVLELKL